MGTSFSSHRTLASNLAAAGVGALTWSGQVTTLPLSFIFVVLVLVQPNRRAAYCVALSYYSASSWSLVPGAHAFFGANPGFCAGIMLWLMSSVLLATPWGLFYFQTWPARFWSAPLALAVTALPPVGLIGWASPLTSAGVLFPGTGWLGIGAVLFLPGAMVRHPRWGVPAAGALMALSNAIYPGAPRSPARWEAIDTTFGRSELERPDPLHEFQNAEWIQQRALNSKARVVIFPETIVPRWNEATEVFWEPTLRELADCGKTIALGSTVVVSSGLGRVNAMIIRGAGAPASFSQRIPPPVSMWKPFSDSGFPLRLSGASTARLGGERAGFLICYELLLSWPVLSASLDHPTILIGVANDYWASQTRIPAVQRAALTAWAQLFSLPRLMAVNT